VFKREHRKSFGFNISSVANQCMPTSTALTYCAKSNPSSSAIVKTCALAAIVSR
jgi:hypothetical protein